MVPNDAAPGAGTPGERSIESSPGDTGPAGHGTKSVTRAHAASAEPCSDLYQYREAVLSEQGPSTAAATVVAVALAQRMNWATLETFVGAKRIAKMTRLAERTVRTALGILRAEGWIAERIEVRPHGRVRVRRALIPSSFPLPANGAGSPARVAARVAGTSPSSGGKSDRYYPGVAAKSAPSTGKIRRSVAAAVAADLLRDHVNDLRRAASPAPPDADSAAQPGLRTYDGVHRV